MITARITSTGGMEVRTFLVNVTGTLEDRAKLNKVLGDRLADELRGYFLTRNPDGRRLGSISAKLNAPKRNFWNQMAAATKLESHSESGATVVVGTNHFNIHLFGGTILPGPGKKALTIPLIAEAVGKRAANYEADTGKKLFTIRGKKALFERTGRGDAVEPGLIGRVRRRNGSSKNVGLVSRTGVRPVFALVKSATIKADPDALPPVEKLLTALQEEADDFIERYLERGGLA
jgi:hypothetical protein